MKNRNTIIWIIATIITLAAIIYQKKTGPTEPVKYKFSLNNSPVKFKLPRSNQGVSDFFIKLELPEEITGRIVFRRYPTNEKWDTIQMVRSNEILKAPLPLQPPAGKLEYFVELFNDDQVIDYQKDDNMTIRFRGDVPAWVMLPHILLMILAMLWSNATGILSVWKIPSYKKHAIITSILFVVGGLIFGPIMQKYAFGEYWTGWPFGGDLTDTKVMVSVIFWILAVVLNRKKDRPWIMIIAALILFIIFMIPHSAAGSEFNYESGQVITGMMVLVTLGTSGLKIPHRGMRHIGEKK